MHQPYYATTVQGRISSAVAQTSESISVDNNKLVELKRNLHLTKSMEELRDRYYGGEGQSRDAFEELCAMYEAIQVIILLLFVMLNQAEF